MPSADRDRLAWLRSQGLGLVCGFSTVILLAVGSFVLAATRDGASAAIGMDDLRGFFAPPRLAHLWLYLLLPVTGLYALNTVLATWDTVSRRWRAGVRAPTAFGASVVHVGFLLALVAHGAAGFFGEDRGEVVLASGWREVPGFGEARLVSLDVETLPNGMPKEAWARLELRAPDGHTSSATVGYNVPLLAGGGSRLALLGDLGRVRVARLASGADACALVEGQSCRIGSESVRLLAVRPLGGRAAAALVEARGPSGREEARWLPSDGELALAGGRPLQLAGVATEPAVLLRARGAPGNPWALAAGLVLAAGVVLLWRKLVPRASPARAAAARAADEATPVQATEG
jgi:hypothetical protein